MINYTVDSQKTLVLTEAELKILEDLLATHDRAGYYIAYNAMVDEGLLSFNGDQASLQARISTFSGPAGGSAFVANRLGQILFGPGGSLEGSSGLPTYAGMYELSQDVAVSSLDFIKQSIEGGGSGVLTNLEFLASAEAAWAENYLLELFPGNLLTPVTSIRTGLESIFSAIQSVFLDSGSTMDQKKAVFSQAVQNAEGGGFFSWGSLFSVLSSFVWERFDKSTSDLSRLTKIEGPNGIDIYIDEDGKVAGIDDKGLGDAGVYGLTVLVEAAAVVAAPLGLGVLLATVFREFLADLISEPLGENYDVLNFTSSAPMGINGDTQSFTPAETIAEVLNWSPEATEGNDILNGSGSFLGFGGKDTINGLGGNDLIFGQGGKDTLSGDEGDDVLWGQVAMMNCLVEKEMTL